MEWQDGSAAIQRVWLAPDELLTDAAALTIMEVPTGVSTSTVPPAQPGPAERPVEASDLVGQGRSAPDELLTDAAALTIMEVPTRRSTGTVPPPGLNA